MLGSKLVSGDSNLCSPKVAKTFMNYFYLYYAYLAQCDKENWANIRDPNHDFMEWNHTLPQCIFGDQPIGQWLTIEQHAIASALQTLAFKHTCLHGKHKVLLPTWLWDLCLPVYAENCVNILSQMTPEQKQKAVENRIRTVSDPEYDWHKVREDNGTLETYTLAGQKQVLDGKGIHNPENRLEYATLGGRAQGRNNVEKKTGMFKRTPEELSAESKKNRARRFQCLVTGKVSNDTGLTKIQKRLGIDTSLRVQIN